MNNLSADLIETIFRVNDRLLQFTQKNIFALSLLTPTQYRILWEILQTNGIWLNILKEKMIMSAPALSQILWRMEKSGLIERQLSKTDKREMKIKPTKKAKWEYEKVHSNYNNFLEQKLSQIKDKDKEIMIKFLEYIEKWL